MSILHRVVRYWLLPALWMGTIFMGSTNALSAPRTSRFIGPFLRWFNPEITDETIRIVQTMVRKGGHMAEYAVLAWLLWRAVRMPVRADLRPWSRRHAILAFTLTVLYAVTDELHQAFTTERMGSVIDVLIDSVGGLLGLGLVYWIWRWRRRA